MTGTDAFVKGTFVWSQTVRSEDPKRIVFYQLPSINRGSGFKQWSIDLAKELGDFWIDPEQDLLVVLEQTGRYPDRLSYNIHLRSMNTNTIHPRTAPDRAIISYTPPVTPDPLVPRCLVRISDHLLVMLFKFVDRAKPKHIVIWDWATGQELSHLTFTDEGSHLFVELLSENSFVICRSVLSPGSDTNFPRNTLGWLSIYRFDPQATTSAQATHAMSFALPVNPDKSIPWYDIALHPAPMTTPLNARSRHHSPNKVYDLTLGDRLLCVDVYKPGDYGWHSSLVGTLYAPSSTLLDELASSSRGSHEPTQRLVTWTEWAGRAFWVDYSKVHPLYEPCIFGHRLIAQQTLDCDALSLGIVVLDFHRRRLVSRGIGAGVRSSVLPQEGTEEPHIAGTRANGICATSTLKVEQTDWKVIQKWIEEGHNLQEEWEHFWPWIDEEHFTESNFAV
ncbi:hypothetical protein FRC10_010056 [Ceratobasidium sp. 414]|nr:hypothetical protein FRC10_010056 [Ceratobasidium sp. 414]